MSYQSYSYSSSSYSSSSSTDPQGTTRRYTEEMNSNDRDGTTIRRTQEETGKQTLEETTQYPAGNRQLGGSTQASQDRRIEDVSDQNDKEYGERMEDEYAKREGGA